MKILVTGANGFLGRGIVTQLNKYNVEVIASGRKTDLIRDDVIKKDGDIFKLDSPFSYFDMPDVLVHLAWNDGFKHESYSHIENLPKHVAFIEDLIKSGVKKIVVLGSVHEVGFYEGSVDENTKCEPQSLYGIAKNSLRQICSIMSKKYSVEFQWIRGFYIVNNESYGNSIFNKVVRYAKEGKNDFPFTQGLNQFDFIDYDLFCDYTAKVIMQNKINGIINVCSGRPEKLSDKVESFIKINNFDIKLNYGAFPDRPYDSKAIWGNSEKLENILKLYVKH